MKLFLSVILILSITLIQLAQTAEKSQNISTISEVLDSGDEYPVIQPTISSKDSKAFKNLKFMFLFADGVEDHEIYYFHNYIVNRGAQTIDFVCPKHNVDVEEVIISDFFKPSYIAKCKNAEKITFEDYDVIYIPGGLPSSAAVKSNPYILKQLEIFYNNPKKILTAICSGTEVLLSAGIITKEKTVLTGSPASAKTFQAFLSYNDRPLDQYQGDQSDDKNSNSITYETEKKAKLVMGRDPAGSVEFVLQVGKVLGLNEKEPTDKNNSKVELVNNRYQHKQMQIIEADSDMKLKDIKYSTRNFDATTVTDFLKRESKKIGLVAFSGAEFDTIRPLEEQLQKLNIEYDVLCPNWVKPYKDGKLFLMSDEQNTALAMLPCTLGFDEVKSDFSKNYDTIIAAGGMFSTNGVLRNDPELSEILDDFMKSKTQNKLVLIDSGVELLSLGQKFGEGHKICTVKEAQDDIEWSGYRPITKYIEIFQLGNTEVFTYNTRVLSKKSESLKEDNGIIQYFKSFFE